MGGQENYSMAKGICFSAFLLGVGDREGRRIGVLHFIQRFIRFPVFLIPLVKHQASITEQLCNTGL